METVKVLNGSGLVLPSGFDQIDLTIEHKAAVNLFTDKAKAPTRIQSKGIEQSGQKFFELVSPRLW